MAKKGLIVDDDQYILRMLTKFFEKHGIQVIAVENGSLAIEKLLINDVSFILTDIEMPILDGIELTYFIQENFPDIPVFLMSSNTDNLMEVSQGCKCVRNIFQKPFKMSFLIQRILHLTNCGELIL